MKVLRAVASGGNAFDGAVRLDAATVNSGAAGRTATGALTRVSGGGTNVLGCGRAAGSNATMLGDGTNFGLSTSGAGVQINCGGRSRSWRPATRVLGER